TLAPTSLLLSRPLFLYSSRYPRALHSFPTRRSSDLDTARLPRARRHRAKDIKDRGGAVRLHVLDDQRGAELRGPGRIASILYVRSEEHTSELQSLRHLVCRLLLEKKKKTKQQETSA